MLNSYTLFNLNHWPFVCSFIVVGKNDRERIPLCSFRYKNPFDVGVRQKVYRRNYSKSYEKRKSNAS